MNRGIAKTANMTQESCALPHIALTCHFDSVQTRYVSCEDMLRYIASLQSLWKSFEQVPLHVQD